MISLQHPERYPVQQIATLSQIVTNLLYVQYLETELTFWSFNLKLQSTQHFRIKLKQWLPI